MDKRRKRGRYKVYLSDPNVSIPRQTIHNWSRTTERQPVMTMMMNDVDMPAESEDESIKSSDDEDATVVESADKYWANENTDDEEAPVASSETNEGADENTDNEEAMEVSGGIRRFTDEDDHSAIFPGSSISVEQANLMVATFVLRHSLTGTALQDLLSLLNELLPGVTPATKFLFEQKFANIRDKAEVHYYCHECTAYIGETEHDLVICQNDQCQAECDINKCQKNGNFFLYLPLESQLKDLLENHGISASLVDKCNRNNSDVYEDIFDGNEMKTLIRENNLTNHDLTLLWNCDGVPIFKSSKYSIWPVQVIVNELPPEDRKKHVLFNALWFGKSTPAIDTVFTRIVEEAKKLGEEGLTWKNVDTNETINSRAFFLTSACDSVARPRIKNSVQFNGKFGCDWCLHPGEMVEKGAGMVRVYPFKVPEPESRTQTQWEDDAIATVDHGPVSGVKGPCQLLFLPLFNIVKGFVPDYMHCVLLGVVKQFVTLWLDPRYHQSEWYLDRHLTLLDSRLLTMKPPKEISRAPRSLSDRKFWKATEWKSFLLYYSLFVLSGTLANPYFQHWCLLSFALHCLLQRQITRDMISKSELMLKKFVISTETLYGKEHVSFNVHLLTHLASSVDNWGPLWAGSAFSFESNNRKLMNFFHGTQHVPVQITKSFLLWRSIPEMVKNLQDTPSSVQEYIQRLWHCSSVLPKKAFKRGKFTFFNSGEPKQIPVRHKIALRDLMEDGFDHLRSTYHNRVQIGQSMYSSQSYSKSTRRFNSAVEFTNGTFGIIDNILALRSDCLCPLEARCNCPLSLIVLYSSLKKKSKLFFKDQQIGFNSVGLVHEVSLDLGTKATYATCIKRKCVLISVEGSKFVVPLVNTVESD